jgi:hypothetical protein
MGPMILFLMVLRSKEERDSLETIESISYQNAWPHAVYLKCNREWMALAG